MALDKFVQAELALGIDAFETDRNWDRRELVGRARSREVWNAVCVSEPTENIRAVLEGSVSLWLNNLPGK